jgi:phosphatidylinositol alpha-1,6-mannosyltransferase
LRTLLISEIFPPKTGGSSRWFWEIYRRLPREEVVIAAGEDPCQAAFDATHDLCVRRLPLRMRQWGLRSWSGSRGYCRGVRHLLRVVKAEQVRRVHCGRCLPEGVMALALRWLCGLPYVCYVHGEDVNTASESRELAWLARRVLRAADLIVANSRNTARILADEWHQDGGRVALLYPGVDTARFVPAPRNRAARDRLGWGDRRVVLTVGRLQRRKGHDHLIRALADIRKVVPDIVYAIVGDGEERPGLEDLAARAGVRDHVQFLGEVPDDELIARYQQCDLFALPNRQVGKDIEGFGMVLLEAQACGIPVLAGASGGTAETMRVPETGRVVDCDDPGRLAAALIELLTGPELLRRMGAAGRLWMVESFDWSALARRAEQLFRLGPTGRAVAPLPEGLGV